MTSGLNMEASTSRCSRVTSTSIYPGWTQPKYQLQELLAKYFLKMPCWCPLGLLGLLSGLLFLISSTEHNMFVCDLFWKWDPFVLTDACSGAVAKAQLDFLDCHARLVIYPLLSDKQNCSFVTLQHNYLTQRHCTLLNPSCLGQGDGISQTGSRPK